MFILSDFHRKNVSNRTSLENGSFLSYITRKWNEIHEENDVFRYKIGKLQGKVVDGYLLRLNPDRNSKRRFPERIDNIFQPFDKDKFNFTKASPKEFICIFKQDSQDTDEHSILVNVSPISRYHSLLCPSMNKCLPQVVTVESLQLVINLMFCAGDRALRIGFNSLCGFASVNHLHYHLFMEEEVLPVEKAKCDHLQGPLYCLSNDYPIPAFCFEITNESNAEEKSMEIYKLIEYFLKHSIAHNILLTYGDRCSGVGGEVVRLLVWPRKSSTGVKPLMAFNVALLELGGWFPIYNLEDYQNLQHSDLESELKKWKVDNFENLCKAIKELYEYCFFFNFTFTYPLSVSYVPLRCYFTSSISPYFYLSTSMS